MLSIPQCIQIGGFQHQDQASLRGAVAAVRDRDQVEDHYYLPEDMAEEQVHEMIGRTELRIVDCGNR